jgi:hypothetical protein
VRRPMLRIPIPPCSNVLGRIRRIGPYVDAKASPGLCLLPLLRMGAEAQLNDRPSAQIILRSMTRPPVGLVLWSERACLARNGGLRRASSFNSVAVDAQLFDRRKYGYSGIILRPANPSRNFMAWYGKEPKYAKGIQLPHELSRNAHFARTLESPSH